MEERVFFLNYYSICGGSQESELKVEKVKKKKEKEKKKEQRGEEFFFYLKLLFNIWWLPGK